MFKTFLTTTAVAALLAGSAVAQQAPRTNPPPTNPPMNAPAMNTPATTQAARQFVTTQTPDQWLVSKNVKGTDVMGPNNEHIGDVTDVLIDRGGRVVAYVIGVGGFLGIGERDVALSPESFGVQPATDREALKLKLAMTRDELKNAPAFTAANQPTATTGQAPRDRAPATTPPAMPPRK